MTEQKNENMSEQETAYEKPDYFGKRTVWLGTSGYSLFTNGSLVIIAIAALIIGFTGNGKSSIPESPVNDAVGWEILRINGNRNARFVDFTHKTHQGLVAEGKEGCVSCHHISRPGDGPSSCYQCHRDMYKKTSVFDHTYHIKLHENGDSCSACHAGDKSPENLKTCAECHKGYTRDTAYYTSVRSYKDAMHGMCVSCHKKEDEKLGEKLYSDCSFCHMDHQE